MLACMNANQMRVDDWRAHSSESCRSLVEFMLFRMAIDPRLLVRAAAIVALDLKDPSEFELCLDLFKSLVCDFSLDVWTCQEELRQLSEIFSYCLFRDVFYT